MKITTHSKKRIKQILALTGFFLLFITTPAFTQTLSPEELKNRIEQKAQELESLNQELQQSEAKREAEERMGQTLTQELNRIDRTIQNTEIGLRQSTVTIEKLNLEIQDLRSEIEKREEGIILRKKAVEALLRDFQKQDTESMLVTMLNNKSLAESVAEAQSIFDLNNGLLTEVSRIKQLKTELGFRLGDVSGKKVNVEQEKQTLEVRKKTTEEQKVERAQLLVKTKENEKIYQEIVSELEARQQEISDEIAEIEEQLRKSVDASALPSKRSGVLGWPTEIPVLTQEYGATAFAQQAYKSKFHNGIDLRAKPTGTRIYAAEDGIVKAVGDNGKVQYGKFILLEHPNNLSTLYAHLSRQAVVEGQTVKRGELIGFSGNTGYSFATHLHFVVYAAPTVIMKNFPGAGLIPVGTTLNPLDYLPNE